MARVIPPLPADGGNVGTWGPILNTAIDYLQDKSLMVVNVTDYPGVQDSASVSSQTGLEEAVTDAIALGAVLHFPAGQYLAATNIPNLHVVRKSGPGRIVTGSSTFYVAPAPGQVNTLFVRATGVDTNDGLTATRPLREIRKAFALLPAYGPTLGGSWIVDVRAGTYKGGIALAPQARQAGSQDFVKVTDPTANVHPTVPTAIVSKAADTAETYGMRFADGVTLQVEGIKFTGAFAQAVSCGRNSYLHAVNVHVDGAVIGFHIWNRSTYSTVGGIIANCTTSGISELFGVVRDHSQAGSTAAGTIIRSCAVGLDAGENCSGHADWLTVEDCPVGIKLVAFSAMNIDAVTLKRNGVAILLKDSEIHDDAGILWGTGVDANTLRILSHGHSSESNFWGWGGVYGSVRLGYRPLVVIAANYTDVTHTGTLTETTLYSFTNAMKAGWWSARGKHLQVIVVGSVGAANLTQPVTLRMRVGTLNANSVVLPAGVLAGSDFQLVFDMVCDVDGASQKFTGRLIGQGVADSFLYVARTFDLSAVDANVQVQATLGATGDSVTLRYGEVWG